MKLLIALGGNALLKPGQKGTAEEQIKNLDTVVSHIVDLVKQGHKIVLTHGNGPQVGNILMQQELSKKKVPEMPLYICVAESQGMIGYMIQDALYDKLHKYRLDIPVITFVTRVIVDKKDPAFRKPTKPVGPVYQTKNLPKEWKITRTLKGYRRVVSSPEPHFIIEAESIKKVMDKCIVIACGGGGVPVVKGPKGYEGIDAVIDKDMASARLAETIKPDVFVILTDVDAVYLNYKKPGQKKLGHVTLTELKKYQKEDHFKKGSMKPKIESVIKYLEKGGKKAIITDFTLLEKALAGKAGTIITK